MTGNVKVYLRRSAPSLLVFEVNNALISHQHTLEKIKGLSMYAKSFETIYNSVSDLGF